jgi:hypothetical protein
MEMIAWGSVGGSIPLGIVARVTSEARVPGLSPGDPRLAAATGESGTSNS